MSGAGGAFPAYPLVSPRQLAEADKALDDAVRNLATEVASNTLSADKKLRIVRAVVGLHEPRTAACPAEQRPRHGAGAKLMRGLWPYQAFWCIPAAAWVASWLPAAAQQTFLALAPAAAWTAFALLDVFGIPVAFHLRAAFAWQVWTAWPHAERAWQAAVVESEPHAAMVAAAGVAGPNGAAAVAMGLGVAVSMAAWEMTRD